MMRSLSPKKAANMGGLVFVHAWESSPCGVCIHADFMPWRVGQNFWWVCHVRATSCRMLGCSVWYSAKCSRCAGMIRHHRSARTVDRTMSMCLSHHLHTARPPGVSTANRYTGFFLNPSGARSTMRSHALGCCSNKVMAIRPPSEYPKSTRDFTRADSPVQWRIHISMAAWNTEGSRANVSG